MSLQLFLRAVPLTPELRFCIRRKTTKKASEKQVKKPRAETKPKAAKNEEETRATGKTQPKPKAEKETSKTGKATKNEKKVKCRPIEIYQKELNL